jgi:Carboxypeptidase regulatory-like domain
MKTLSPGMFVARTCRCILRNAVVSSLYLGLLIVGMTICLSPGAPVRAQSTSTGTVSGQVTDPQNDAVPGASVTLRDVTTNAEQKTVTNNAGRYTFVNVPPGNYDILVSKTGFVQAKLTGEKVTVGLVLTVNVTMQIGSMSETVVVTAMGADLQTSNASVGTTISGRHLEMLTNLGRDANALFVLQPAVTPTGSVAGAVLDQNTFQLDGGNNSSDMDGTQNVYTQSSGFIGSAAAGGTPSGVIPTPAESIEEFRVTTNNQTADFNGASGGQIQMVTKRGGNQWHGSVYEYYFGSEFGANTWANNRTGEKLPSSHQNRFGASAGGPITPEFWGGKTYLFTNYEARRFPQSITVPKTVPSALLRAGVIQVQNSGTGARPVTLNGITYQVGDWIPYNLNPNPVTVNGITYQPARIPGPGGDQLLDPRGFGLNPLVNQIWSRFMPLPNDPSCSGVGGCDQFNTQSYRSPIRLPQESDFFVARLDHDFGPNWRFMASYRYYRLNQLANTQFDIGGALPGTTFGQATSTAPRSQKPSYYVAGLTTTISPTLTNDFRWNYLRNFWEWSTAGAPPQLPGLGGALEIGGETANALIPYNVNAQNARTRFWDGQGHTLRDDLTLVRGNHVFQFGGSFQRNFMYHQRNDNGQSTMAATTYVIQGGSAVSGLSMTAGGITYRPAGLPSTQQNNWDNLYAQVLGLVTLPQVVYSRSGPQLNLQPLGTPAFDKSIVLSYNTYFSDTWRMKPSFTFTYGLGYTYSTPPYEIDGKQVMLVDQAGTPIATEDYLAQRKKAALAGQVYNPVLGFATVQNVGGGRKYPFDPFYGGFSPRLALAWNPTFKSGLLSAIFGQNNTVFRGGYSRIYGRLNGVELVLVPLLGTGLLQAVSCEGAVRADAAINGNQCLGVGGANPITAFRAGTDGLVAPLPTASATLAQPYFPGVGGNTAAGDGSALDPRHRPSYSDQFDFTIQRELVPRKVVLELGYIGRISGNEWQQINLDAVPHMTTLDGQSFSDAFAKVYTAISTGGTVTTQPWFESALGGQASAYCRNFASCTAAVAANQRAAILNTQVYNLWNNLSNQSSWRLGRTMAFSSTCANSVVSQINPSTPVPVCSQLRSIFMNTSLGHGNYNAAFVTLTLRDWRGLSATSNFTWSHALGTGTEQQARSQRSVVDPWDLDANYGAQDFDIRYLYNLSALYDLPFYKNQRGVLGRLLGGWSISPLFTAHSGLPLRVAFSSNCQSFGEVNCSSGSSWENAPFAKPYTGGNTAHKNLVVNGTVGSNTTANRGTGINLFAKPDEVYSQFRRLVLGLDHRGGGAGPIRGLPRWNLDLSIAKDIKINERMGMTFSAQFANFLNHFQPADPPLANMNIDNPATFGLINSQFGDPRQIEFGLRFRF